MRQTQCGFDDILGGATAAQQLIARGPTLLVDIGFDPGYKPGLVTPPTSSIQGVSALVDTGATTSCIDDGIAQSAGLPAIDKQKIGGVNGEMVANIYLAQIYIPSLNETINSQFAGVHLIAGGQQHAVLIGRTFLNKFTMIYDGRTGRVTLIDLVSGTQGPIQPPASGLLKSGSPQPNAPKKTPPLPGLGGGPWKS